MKIVKRFLEGRKAAAKLELGWADPQKEEHIRVINKLNKEIEEIDNALLILCNSSLQLKNKEAMTFEEWLLINFEERQEKDGVYQNRENKMYNTKEFLKKRFENLSL